MGAEHQARDANHDRSKHGHGQDTGAPAKQQSGEAAGDDSSSGDVAARRLNIGRAEALRAREEG